MKMIVIILPHYQIIIINFIKKLIKICHLTFSNNNNYIKHRNLNN